MLDAFFAVLVTTHRTVKAWQCRNGYRRISDVTTYLLVIRLAGFRITRDTGQDTADRFGVIRQCAVGEDHLLHPVRILGQRRGDSAIVDELLTALTLQRRTERTVDIRDRALHPRDTVR